MRSTVINPETRADEPASIPGFNVTGFLRAIKEPYDTQNVFDIYRTMITSGKYEDFSQCYIAAAKKDEGLQELYRQHFSPRFPAIGELLKYQEGSLGRALAQHLVRNKIDVDFQGIDVSNAFDRQESFDDYVRVRSLHVHDVLHVLIDADTTPIGEGEVAAFLAAQYGGPLHAMILTFATAHLLFCQSDKLHEGLNAIHRAFEIGRQARPYYGVPWENLLHENLDTLRRRFNFRT